MKTNAGNERIKHAYFEYLKEAMQLGEHSINAVSKALDRFERHTGRKDFKRFDRQQAVTFKKHLADQPGARSGTKLSKATVLSTLSALKAFFFWLAREPGFRSHLQYDDARFFNMSLKDTAIAKAVRQQRVPTLDQIAMTVASMHFGTPIEMRARALVAVTIVTGARDDAIASMRLKHLDLSERCLFQDARDMRTKFSKSFSTWFFPVKHDFEAILHDWVAYLKDQGFGPNDPVFPLTKTGFNTDGTPASPSLGRECWASAAPIRAIFKEAFDAAGLPYFNPHSFRKTLVRYGMSLGLGEDGMKAWSQNLGHDDVQTTYRSYGELPPDTQRDLMRAAETIDADDKRALELGRQALAAARKKDEA